MLLPSLTKFQGVRTSEALKSPCEIKHMYDDAQCVRVEVLRAYPCHQVELKIDSLDFL